MMESLQILLREARQDAIDKARGISFDDLIATYSPLGETGALIAGLVVHIHELEDRVKELETEIGRMEAAR